MKFMRKKRRLIPTLLVLGVLGSSFLNNAWSAEAEQISDGRKLALATQAKAVARELRDSRELFDRIAGAGALADVGDDEALKYLANMIQHEEFVYQRAALDTLLSVRNAIGPDVLKRYVLDGNDRIFLRFVTESLASQPRDSMTDFLLDILEYQDSAVKKFALQSLAQLPSEKRTERVLQLANDESQASFIRAYAWNALLGTVYQEQSIKKLFDLSFKGSSQAKEAAAVALGRVDTPESKAVLLELSLSDNERVAIAAMTSRAGLGHEESMIQMKNMITDGYGIQRAAAAGGLRRINPQIAARITGEVLDCCDLEPYAAMRLIEAWANIDADPSRVYAWGLGHRDEGVRMQSIWLAGQRYDLNHLEQIASMLSDVDPGIRGIAAWAILRMTVEPS
ncbi:MAG: hypothetical protein AAF384_15830 [Pseudomonadota bacterium]